MYISLACSLRAQKSDGDLETEFPKFVQSLVGNYDELSADGILNAILRLRGFLKAAKFQKKDLLVGVL